MQITDLIFGWQSAVAAEFILTWAAIYYFFMRPRRRAAQRQDARFGIRFSSQFKGWLKWDGKQCNVRGIDLSKSGALVSSSVALRPGSRVFLYIESRKLMGWAEVRHCAKRGWFGYQIGLEFRGSLMRTINGDWDFATVPGQA